jgi:hypothetical protein
MQHKGLALGASALTVERYGKPMQRRDQPLHKELQALHAHAAAFSFLDFCDHAFGDEHQGCD